MADLSGRTILVTGAGGGIGRATCARLVADGARVAALDLDPEAAAAVAAHVGSDLLAPFVCDVGDEDSVRAATAAAIARFGPLTGVFANAGIPSSGALHDTSLAEWDRALRVNLTGIFLTVKHALPSMIEAGGGAIVTTGSLSSTVATAGGGGAAYKATKGGVNLLTKSIAVEYAAYGIRANCIGPGAIDTGFAGTGDAPRGPLTGVAAATPMRRRGMPEEVAAVVSFLLSEDAAYMTGTLTMVDGGYTAC